LQQKKHQIGLELESKRDEDVVDWMV
jgi:hypothetical protein